MTDPAERRARRQRRPDTYARIAEAALELFSTRGFAETTMRELADKLGMTTAALYYHYTDKADILVQLVEPMLDDADRLVAEAEGVDSTVDERLERLVDLLLEHQVVFRLLTADLSARKHPAIAERVDVNNRALFRLFAGDRQTGDQDSASVIRAVAVLHAVHGVVTTTNFEVDKHRDVLLDVAAGIMSGDSGRRRPRTATRTRVRKAV